MKVFISWSGKNSASHKVAIALRRWLPCVISYIKPFVSSEDIQKGERGLSKLEEMLNNSGFGILCVTKENYKAPWMLFEAGALSNNPNQVRVVPFLFGLTPSDLTGSPIIQFQATAYSDKESVRKLIQSLNASCGKEKLDDNLLDKIFERWYPELSEALSAINSGEVENENEPSDDTDKSILILEEILEITRNNQKALLNDNFTSSIDYDKIKYLLTNTLEECGIEILSSHINNDKGNLEYEVIIEFRGDDGITNINFVAVDSKMVVADILDKIYSLLEGRVGPFTYLLSWMLQESKSKRPLVVSGI